MSAPYRRLLWSPEGVEVTVCSEAEEAEKVAQGYRLTAEAPAGQAPSEAQPVYTNAPGDGWVVLDDQPTFGAAHDGTDEGPTEGAADDGTHEKKPKRKK